MNRQLVFVHGRAQEGKDSLGLKQEWIAAWAKGLAKHGLQLPIAETDIRFPYYGDTLAQMTEGKSADEAARIIVRGELDQEEQSFIRDYLEQVQAATGITDEEILQEMSPEARERGVLNWGWVQALLEVVDRHVPMASAATVALFTQDTFRYLHNVTIRNTMNDGVRAAFAEQRETVVVGHSLGSVIAYNVLRHQDNAGLKVPLFVTLGSPLGINVIRKSLRPIGHPGPVGTWFNAMDERDVVALFPLVKPHFGIVPAIENKVDVDNDTVNRHGISGYLSDPEVARRIYDALVS
ncbi:hypothetical protein [Massilia sp. BSC265]|uniref:hypothetical protein n=1 Tax=Massilia sp. BSC265 TaxID=1549812 RepID=UPI0004E94D51|nr:hypothetical protein [Massilia sp. BSC265]KFI06094.1 hypothetical protein JN27_18510 [Massilia sp. BSC265]